MMTFRLWQAEVVRVLAQDYGIRQSAAIAWTTNNEVRLREQFADAMMAAEAAALLATSAGIGTCDTCEKPYDVSSRIDHCPECGTCWEHCTKPAVHDEREGLR